MCIRFFACVLSFVVLFAFAIVLKADPKQVDRDVNAAEIQKLRRKAQELSESLEKANRRVIELEGRRRELLVEPAKLSSLPVGLRQKFAEIQQEVQRLRKDGKTKEADELVVQVRRMLIQARDPLAGVDPKKAELHVVGLYEGAYPDGNGHGGGKHPQGVAKVELNYPTQPVILALCSYEPVKWEVKLGEKTQVQKVILSGYYDQSVVGIPKTIPVQNFSGREQPDPRFYAYRKDDYVSYLNLVRALRKLTGLEVATFQGSYAFKGEPFLLGVDNESWRHQLVEHRIGALHRRATAYQRAQLRQQMQGIRFKALHLTTSQEGLRYHTVKSSWGEFTPTGPIAPTLQPSPGNIAHMAVDPKGPTYYGIKGHSVVRLDPKTKAATELAIDANLPKLSWPCGLAYDSTRRRLILVSLGGEGVMYSYEIEDDKWSVVTSMKNVDLAGLAYSAEDDMLYGLQHTHGRGFTTIYKMTVTGAIVGQSSIEMPIPTMLHDSVGNVQLIAVGKYVVIVTSPSPDLDTTGEPILQRSYVIDPGSGKIVFTSVLRPHAGIRDLKPNELAKLWERLAEANSIEVENVMWQMATGTDQTVAFLRKNIKPLPKPDEKRVDELISQLDDEAFKTREAAYRELEKLGDVASVQLTKALESSPSVEVRNSARRLVAQVEQGVSTSPEVLRDMRAIRVLGRIATTSAAEYLKELTRGRATAARTREAQSALNHLEQQ